MSELTYECVCVRQTDRQTDSECAIPSEKNYLIDFENSATAKTFLQK